MNSMKEIEQIICERTNKSDRILRGIWGVDCFFNPSNNGRVFDYKFIVSQTKGQGCAYSTNLEYQRECFCSYIGKDFLEKNIDDFAMKVSLFDSVFGLISKPKNCVEKIMNAPSDKKLKWRTSIVLEEAKKLLGNLNGKRIVNVGVVGDFIKSFAEKGALVVGTDFDESIIGKQIFGNISIIHGSNTLNEIANSDLAIVTGMTITTQTIDEIIDCCQKNNVKLIVFAETGANIAGYYINRGVDVFLAEHFPFYIFNGVSVIDVCYPE